MQLEQFEAENPGMFPAEIVYPLAVQYVFCVYVCVMCVCVCIIEKIIYHLWDHLWGGFG